MSLFDGQHIPTLTTYIPTDTENESVPQPLLYIGERSELFIHYMYAVLIGSSDDAYVIREVAILFLYYGVSML